MDALQRLIAALWLGSAFFLMLSASAAFRAAGNTSVAADVVGSMLTRWHYIALAAPLALFALELRRARPLILVLLFVAILFAAAQSFVDLRIRAMRAESPVSISSLDREDPVRRRFGALHGISMMLLLAQTLIAATAVLARSDARKPMEVEAVDNLVYKVVVNEEEQYSLWPDGRENALGWRDTGFTGTKAQCLGYVEKMWSETRTRPIGWTDTTGGGP